MLSPAQRPVTPSSRLRARTDLRSGKLCAGALRLPTGLDTSFQSLIDALLCAQTRWQRISAAGPLHVALPFTQLTHSEHAAHLDAALAANGLSPDRLHLEIDESAFALGTGVLAALERLRGRGWQLGLRSADCPRLALDARTRCLFGTLVLAQAKMPTFEAPSDEARYRRVDAAKAAGWSVVLLDAPPPGARAQLIAAGFDAFEDRLGPLA